MIDGIMKAFRCKRCDMPADICKACVEKVEVEVASLKLQNKELRKTLGAAIQYVEHSRIGHPRNEETMEVTFDPTCFKCKALRVYFGPEEAAATPYVMHRIQCPTLTGAAEMCTCDHLIKIEKRKDEA